MGIKTIAVVIDGVKSAETLIEYAVNMASDHAMRLVCVFRMPVGRMADAVGSEAFGHRMADDLLRHRAEEESILVANCRHLVEQLAARRGLCFAFRTYEGDDEWCAHLGSLNADLVIAAMPDDAAQARKAEDADADTLRTSCNIPLLLIPEKWSSPSAPQNILIGWNGTQEAERAVGEALPLLQAAASVTVLMADEEGVSPRRGAADLAAFLVRQGVRLTVEQLRSGGQALADSILDFVTTRGHDLMVFGAFSHSRSRQLLCGGAGRSLLARSPVPLLIAH